MKKKAPVRFLVFILLASIIFSLFFQDLRVTKAQSSDSNGDPNTWSMFHSDLSHTGSSTSNGPTTNQTLWSYTTDSYPVNTSPAIIGGYAYFGSEDDKVYCLNATTGAIVWSYTTGAAIASSPAVADGYVYVGSVDDNVYCLNANTGAYVWSFKTGGYVDTPSATAGDESPPPCSIIPKLNPINRIQRINIAVP